MADDPTENEKILPQTEQEDTLKQVEVVGHENKALNGAVVTLPNDLFRYAVDTGDKQNLHLDLSRRNVRSALLTTLCDFVLLLNTPLVSLTLSRNALGPNGAMLLGKALVTNNTLQFLELDNCELIGSVYRPQYNGIKALAKGFESARSKLRFVNLAKNHLQPEGCRIVLGALSFHKSLTALDFSNNLLSLFNNHEGILALSYTLRYAKQLCWLAIDNNPVTSSSWKILQDSLAANTTLTSLSAVHCHLPEPFARMNPCVLTDLRT